MATTASVPQLTVWLIMARRIHVAKATIRMLSNVMVVEHVFVAPVSVLSVPIRRISFRANIVNARTSVVNATKIYCALVPIMAPASAIAVSASPAGRAAVATVPHRRIHVCHRMVVKSALATVPVSAACVNVILQLMVALRVNTVTNAPLARDVVRS